MMPASQLITVTLCCSKADLDTVRSLQAALERDALDVQIYAGVDLDARVLEQMNQPRSPGVFVLCESEELDIYQLPTLEGRFEAYRLERDRLVNVNLETDELEDMLERIRPRVAEIAGEEETLNPASSKRADISDAIALAQRMAQDSAKTQSYRRVSSLPEVATQAYERVPTDATSNDEAEDGLDIEVEEDEVAAAVPVAAGAESSSGRGGLVAVAAMLGLVLVGGLGYLVWSGALGGEQVAAASSEPAAAEQAAAPAVEQEPEQPEPEQQPESEQPAPEDTEVLANAVEPSALEGQAELEPLDDAGALDDAEPAEDPEVLEVVTEPEPEQKKSNEPLLRVEPAKGEIRKHEELEIAPVTDYEFGWHDAANHCRLHKRSGKTGWRLTSIHQLEELRKAGKLEPGRYWSMTLAIVGSTRNFILDTDKRGRQNGDKHEDKALALCVRKTK